MIYMHGCVFCIMSFCFYFSIMLVKLIRWDFLVFFLLLTKILFSSWLKKNYSISFKKNQTSYLLLVCHVSFSNALFVPGWKGYCFVAFCFVLFMLYIFLTFFSFRVYWRNYSRVQEELAVPLQWWTANIPCRRQSGLV